MEESYEVKVEELRREIDKIGFGELNKYQLIKVANYLTRASMELVVIAREPDESIRLRKAHRVMTDLMARLERMVNGK